MLIVVLCIGTAVILFSVLGVYYASQGHVLRRLPSDVKPIEIAISVDWEAINDVLAKQEQHSTATLKSTPEEPADY